MAAGSSEEYVIGLIWKSNIISHTMPEQTWIFFLPKQLALYSASFISLPKHLTRAADTSFITKNMNVNPSTPLLASWKMMYIPYLLRGSFLMWIYELLWKPSCILWILLLLILTFYHFQKMIFNEAPSKWRFLFLTIKNGGRWWRNHKKGKKRKDGGLERTWKSRQGTYVRTTTSMTGPKQYKMRGLCRTVAVSNRGQGRQNAEEKLLK